MPINLTQKINTKLDYNPFKKYIQCHIKQWDTLIFNFVQNKNILLKIKNILN